jgi:hypothetical protein
MAIGAVTRGCLAVVHDGPNNIHGLFLVDSVSGSDIYVFPMAGGYTADQMNDEIQAGRSKANRIHIQIGTIWAVYPPLTGTLN